jgi:hypothetical protein
MDSRGRPPVGAPRTRLAQAETINAGDSAPLITVILLAGRALPADTAQGKLAPLSQIRPLRNPGKCALRAG